MDTGTTRQTRRAPARLPIWKKALFGVIPALLLLIGAEVIARQLPAAEPVKIEPYVSLWQAHWHGDFWVSKPGPEINAEGFRDRDHEVEKPPGRWRIACLGDSVTLGPGIPRHKTWSAHLEQYLSSTHPDVEVFNVSMGGWCIRQERAAYDKFVRKYDVDDVILGICLNDIPEVQNNTARNRVPAFVHWLHRHSALVRAAVNAKTREVGSVRELMGDGDAPHVNNAWKLFFEEILEFREELEREGVRLSILLFPFRFQVLPAAPEPTAQKRMAEFCRKHDIPFWDVLDTFKGIGPSAFFDYDHLSAAGSGAAARYIFESGQLTPPAR